MTNKTNMTDEQLAQELRKGKGGKVGGKLLALLGVAVAIVGIVLGINIVMIVIGGVLLALGQMVQGKRKEAADRQVFDTLAPEVVNSLFENADLSPTEHILRAEDSGIPLPDHSYNEGKGYIRGLYKGLPTEMCTVVLTDVDEVQREETGLWEKNEHVVYTGQWMLCQLGTQFPTGLTFWPRGRLDKLLNSRTIKTEYEDFNKRFNLSCDDEQWALRFLNQSRMERIFRLADSAFSEFAVTLCGDGRLYIAAHSGHGFFDAGKGRETPDALRQRFTIELTWFTDVIDTFRPV